MYSAKVTLKAQEALEARLRLRLTRYTREQSWTLAEHLSKLRDEEGKWKRDLSAEEKGFIRNEVLLSSIDYHYWTRYAMIIHDQGGLSPFTPWESQTVVLNAIAHREEQIEDMAAKGEPVDGILIAQHKARQLGATALARTMLMHRLTTQPYTRGLTASVNDDMVLAIQQRDERILGNLPTFLVPEKGYAEKGRHIIFPKLDSSLRYQEYVQLTGLGQGEQFEIGHMTEVASAPNPLQFRHNYFPTIPQNKLSLHILESTAQGRGDWWHEFVEDCRRGNERWTFVFVPYYAEPSKYRRTPPPDWVPDEIAMTHAKRIYETSPEYVGKALMIPKDQLYWWRTTRDEYQRRGELNIFLTNYAANVEESFQHATRAAFDTELIEFYRSQTFIPKGAFEIRLGGGQA